MSQEGIGGLMSMYGNPRTGGFINRVKRFPDYQPTTKLTTNLGALPDDPERLSTRINAFPRLQKFLGYVPDRFQVINFLVGEYPETFGKQEGYLLMETMSDAKLENIAADALEKKSMQTGSMAPPVGMAEGGLAMSDKDMLEMLSNRNIRDILGEKGRTISNMDRAIAAGMGSPMMSDNEPMMQDRSPANQMFSIDAQIENLMKSYNMLVNAQEFDRAQEVVNQIDQLQQQKIGIQAQNDPFILQKGSLSNLSDKAGPMIGTLSSMNIREMLGESGKTISNQDREIISSLLESISE